MSSQITSRPFSLPTTPPISPHHIPTHHQPVYTQDSLGIPLGKYYPSNYKYRVSTTVAPVPDEPRALSPMNHDSGLWHKKRTIKKKTWSKSHEQNSKASDVTLRLQQYQREMMIIQARNAVKERNSGTCKSPERVTLHPIETDYDRITPFELGETETSGYISEGERRRFERQQVMANTSSKNVEDIKKRLMRIISSA